MASGGRIGVIGGSGVQLKDQVPWTVQTPFGPCLISALDKEKQVLFASRHHCTTIDSSGKASYAPPHEVNYKALIWALCVEEKCTGGIVSFGSSGTLDPQRIPVGSIVMSDDYYMVRPEPISFWGNDQIGGFDLPESNGIGRIHYTPADPLDDRWIAFRRQVAEAIRPTLKNAGDKVRLAAGQTPELWPCAHSYTPGKELNDSVVYVNSIGPRFETRAEIRAYRAVGHVVGMTCGREWALCEEIKVPYCLVCFCDNACNGLSTHPGGALQEYLDHKQAISSVTADVIQHIVKEFSKQACEPADKLARTDR